MALEHTRNKYYGDLAKRPNTIRERKADSDVLARAEKAKAALRASSVMGGLQDKNYGARVDRVRKAAPKAAAKPSPSTSSRGASNSKNRGSSIKVQKAAPAAASKRGNDIPYERHTNPLQSIRKWSKSEGSGGYSKNRGEYTKSKDTPYQRTTAGLNGFKDVGDY